MKYLQFALRNNELVSIYDVSNGLACDCVCPECGATLIARQGSNRTYHFAHYKSEECEKGIETALHLLGKRIVEQTKRLFVPRIPGIEKSVGKVTEYDEAIEEKRIDGSIKPDVQLRARMNLWGAGLVLNVEIRVSHAVDDAKKYKLLELGIPTVEIDLSNITRAYELLSAIIENNPIKGYGKEIFERIKQIFARGEGIGNKEFAELKELGFEVVSEKNHYKIVFQGDERYWFPISKTPSDARSGKNLASDIIKKISIYK